MMTSIIIIIIIIIISVSESSPMSLPALAVTIELWAPDTQGP